MAETCNCILYIATDCNIVVFMTMYIYRYTHTTALYYWFKVSDAVSVVAVLRFK